MVRTRSQLSNEQSTALTSGYTLSSTREPSLNNRHATSASTSSPTPKDVQPLSKTAEQNVKGPSRLVEIGTEINVEEGEEVQDEDDGAEMIKWGCILLIGSAISFLVGIWSIAIGPLVETEGLGPLHLLAHDTYYKYLIVLLIPFTTCCVIINWWGLKIFRHA